MRGGPSTTGEQGESLSQKRKRQKYELQAQRQQSAAAQRATIQVKTCTRWENGTCRYISFLGFRACTKAHPNEAEQTQNIECSSSAVRAIPERCYFANGKCPYRGHRESY